jgi:hypothetical protein
MVPFLHRPGAVAACVLAPDGRRVKPSHRALTIVETVGSIGFRRREERVFRRDLDDGNSAELRETLGLRFCVRAGRRTRISVKRSTESACSASPNALTLLVPTRRFELRTY